MELTYKGKNAIVTGASGGMGARWNEPPPAPRDVGVGRVPGPGPGRRHTCGVQGYRKPASHRCPAGEALMGSVVRRAAGPAIRPGDAGWGPVAASWTASFTGSLWQGNRQGG